MFIDVNGKVTIFKVLEGDGLPPYICQKCISRLNVAYYFKTQCEASDARLRQCFENLQHMPPTPDLTGFIEVKRVSSYEQNGAVQQDHVTSVTSTEMRQTDEMHEIGEIHGTSDAGKSEQVEGASLQTLQNVQLESNQSLQVRNDFY